jgi:hypothetical protein
MRQEVFEYGVLRRHTQKKTRIWRRPRRLIQSMLAGFHANAGSRFCIHCRAQWRGLRERRGSDTAQTTGEMKMKLVKNLKTALCAAAVAGLLAGGSATANAESAADIAVEAAK